MTLSPRVRKLLLTAHVATSLGWLGAVVVFLVLAIAGLTSDNALTVRAAYLAMEPAARFALVPLSLLALLTGVVQSLGTPWGLLRHYWVVFKLLINVIASVYLLLYLPSFTEFAVVAADGDVDLEAVRNVSPALHSVLALLILLAAAVLAVYKPRGVTPYGEHRRLKPRQQRTRLQPRPTITPSGGEAIPSDAVESGPTRGSPRSTAGSSGPCGSVASATWRHGVVPAIPWKHRSPAALLASVSPARGLELLRPAPMRKRLFRFPVGRDRPRPLDR